MGDSQFAVIEPLPVLLFVSISVGFVLFAGWTLSTNETGTVSLIKNGSNSFFLDSQDQIFSCANLNVTSLHIGEVIHLVQPHNWPFSTACQITVVSG